MKRFFFLLLVLVLICLASVSCTKQKPTLYIFNWSDYIDPSLIQEFEEQNNCRIKYSTYDSNENMLTKVKSARESFDLLFPSGDHVSIMSEIGLLEPLDVSKLTNYKNLNGRLLDKAKSFDPGNVYSVPYFWGLTGLLYNKQYVPEHIMELNSWGIISDPFFDGKNKITMLDDAREVIGAALIFKGYSLNDTSKNALDAVKDVLAGWDKNITQFDSDSYKNEVPDGTTWVAQAYNGDALQQMAENNNLGFILPKEGTSLWMDSIVMLKSSKNKELAYRFIDFLLDTDRAKRNSEYTQYPTPVESAMNLLSDDFKGNLLINPPIEYLEKCHMIEYLGDKIKEIDSIFEAIKLN